jgi:transposase-like protein
MIDYGKKVKYYDMTKKPSRQAYWTKGIIYPVSLLTIKKYEHAYLKIGMEDIKPPFILLVNHSQFLDFMVNSIACRPYRINNVVSIDGFNIWPWLLERVGSIPKRKFTASNAIFFQAKTVLAKNKDIFCIYPEARYSETGVPSSFDSYNLSRMIKLYKVPVVFNKLEGHHINHPNWATAKRAHVPIRSTLIKLLSENDVENKSINEIDEILRSGFTYNDYQYQLDNNILVKDEKRAEGLHKVLYQCPHCKSEFNITSSLDKIKCEECGAEYELTPLGQLKSTNRETVFTTIYDWYDWQRSNVIEQINNNTYSMEFETHGYSMPHPSKTIDVGECFIHHDNNGFVIKGNYKGVPFEINKKPIENYSVHVEYLFPYLKKQDIISISTLNDTLFMIPKLGESNRLQKVLLAAEELFKVAQKTN